VLGTVELSDGVAAATVPATATAPGARRIVARYLGDATSAASAATGRVRITKATTGIKARLADRTITTKQHGAVVVVLDAGAGVQIRGELTVRSKGVVLKRVRVTATHDGRRTVTLPRLERGKHPIVVRFGGSALVSRAKSSAMTLTVRR